MDIPLPVAASVKRYMPWKPGWPLTMGTISCWYSATDSATLSGCNLTVVTRASMCASSPVPGGCLLTPRCAAPSAGRRLLPGPDYAHAFGGARNDGHRLPPLPAPAILAGLCTCGGALGGATRMDAFTEIGRA